jgi:cation transporter-like permease
MNFERRRRVEVFWRNVSTLAVLGFLLGLVVTVAGLAIGIVAGTFMVLWVGLALAGVGVVGLFVAMTAAAGMAKMDVDAAVSNLRRREEERNR